MGRKYRYEPYHVLITASPDDGAEMETDVLHPDSCEITISSNTGLRRNCAVTFEIEEAGLDTLFPGEDQQPGMLLVRGWTEDIPGNPSSGFSRYETGVEVVEISEVNG